MDNLIQSFNKRSLFLKKYNYGKNNLGHITARYKQNLLYKATKSINKNYNYIFNTNIYLQYTLQKGLYAKIIDISKISRTRQFVYKISFLNSPLLGDIKFIPITKKSSIGDIIVFGSNAPVAVGNIMPIGNIQVGNYIHHIESTTHSGAVFVKQSKTSAFITHIGEKYATIKLPSGELRLINKHLFCIYGELMYSQVHLNKTKKAGFSRYIGKRPKVRGVAMNACDHPHGGGEGKSPIGRKSAYSIWGKLFRGVKTRSKTKYSYKYIIKNNK